MNPKFYSKIDKQIKESPLTEKGKYVYSDLGMLLLQKIIERQAGKRWMYCSTKNFINHWV